MNNKYKIKTVEVHYNENEEQFDKFLQSALREYINEDKLSPDEVKTTAEKSA